MEGEQTVVGQVIEPYGMIGRIIISERHRKPVIDSGGCPGIIKKGGEDLKEVHREDSGGKKGMHQIPEPGFPFFTVRQGPRPSTDANTPGCIYMVTPYRVMGQFMDERNQERLGVQIPVHRTAGRIAPVRCPEIARLRYPVSGNEDLYRICVQQVCHPFKGKWGKVFLKKRPIFFRGF